MPISTISMHKGRTVEQKRVVADCVQDALIYAGYPDNDRFQRLIEFDDGDLIIDPVFPNLHDRPRTKSFVLIEILISQGRPDSMKQDMLHKIFENLAQRAGIAASDVMVIFHETDRTNLSIYRGVPGDELPQIRPRATT
jgi:phenylpyruvate tautomerase PptA (4-oxalocrotonate tautomerase family)